MSRPLPAFLALPLDDSTLAQRVYDYAGLRCLPRVPGARVQRHERMHITLLPPRKRAPVDSPSMQMLRAAVSAQPRPGCILDQLEAWHAVWVLRVLLPQFIRDLPRYFGESAISKPHLTILKDTGGAGCAPNTTPFGWSEWRPRCVQVLESHTYRLIEEIPFAS